MLRFSYLFLLVWILSFSLSEAQSAGHDILFTSDRDGNREIYAMSPDGSQLRRLTTSPLEDIDPAWSPDRTQIAFASNRDGNFAIYLMNTDGSNVRRVTNDNHGSYNGSPTWSPDGRSLAFVSNANGGSHLYLVDIGGSEPRRLTDGPEEYLDPAWSPDGQWIAYSSDQNGNFEIHLLGINTGEQRQLTNDTSMFSDTPAWSVDGTQIAFAGNSSSGDIFVMNADGSNQRVLTGSQSAFASSPSFSQDGSELVYVLKERDGSSAIYVIGIDGMSARQLPNLSGQSDAPSWSSPERLQTTIVQQPASNTRQDAPSCGNAPPPRMVVGQRGRVTPGLSNNIRNGPSPDYGRIGSIQAGREFTVLDGPRCGDGYQWWQVNYNGVIGWTAEGERGDYWLEPIAAAPPANALGSTSATTTVISTSCPGAQETLFRSGDTAVVDFGGRDALRILTRIDGGAQQTIAQAYNDNTLRLLDGPACGRWNGQPAWYWYVDFQGYRGWTAESSPTSRWMCPSSNPECGY